ncbi:MAG: uridine kinase [Colwellia sp.]|jgi:uridine kinase
MNTAKVIAISGASGAGKTTVVKILAQELNCPILLFDDYISKDTYPKNMKRWLNNGANVSLIKTPNFVDSLKALTSTNTKPYIFIEEPFGKERDAMSSLIDYVVLLDQPLELCLTRLIKRYTQSPHPSAVNYISNFLNMYEDHFRDIYSTTVKQVSRNCDLRISEGVSIKETIDVINNWLKNQPNRQL